MLEEALMSLIAKKRYDAVTIRASKLRHKKAMKERELLNCQAPMVRQTVNHPLARLDLSILVASRSHFQTGQVRPGLDQRPHRRRPWGRHRVATRRGERRAVREASRTG